MKVIYSGTDKNLYSSLLWMLTESHIAYEHRVLLYQVAANDAEELYQVSVPEEDWEAAARTLGSLVAFSLKRQGSNPVHSKLVQRHPEGAVMLMLIFGLLGGLAIANLLHDPAPCSWYPPTMTTSPSPPVPVRRSPDG